MKEGLSMKIFSVRVSFDVSWLLSDKCPRANNVLKDVVEVFRKRFENRNVLVERISYNMCKVIICSDEQLDKGDLERFLLSSLSYCDSEECISVYIEMISPEELRNLVSKIDLDDETRKYISDTFKFELVAEVEKVEKVVTPAESSPKSEEKKLVGVEAFNEWASEIRAIGNVHKKLALEAGLFNGTAYLMSINRGNGLTSILHNMAHVLSSAGLFSFTDKDHPVFEHHLEYPTDTNRPEEFPSFEGLVRRIIGEKGIFGGIAAINIEEWVDHLYDRKFDKVLDFMWTFRSVVLFVFTIPYADDSVIRKIEARIKDIMSVRTMKFVPPSDSDYFEHFKGFFTKYEITVSDEVKNHFVTALSEEKNDGKFYGFNTIKKIANEVLYFILADSAKKGTELPKVIDGAVFDKALGLGMDMGGLSGIEQLEGMVALNEVKSKVREILLSAKLQREMFLSGKGDGIRPCYHMMFTGNPGTGKTVVARIVGRIFKEEGLLSVGNFFEVSRKDFVGKFVGHTAPKTMEICRNAIGSVLFIDEAYTLANEKDGFSSEAIGTLIAEMENHRDDMVVIFAGYEKELEALFDMNPGLRDRIPNKVHFPNYSREELEQIFFLNLGKKISYDESFKEKADEFFRTFPEAILSQRDFSNGRFVRNLAERIVSKSALRFEMSGEKIENFCLCANDFEVAVADNDYTRLFVKPEKTSRIGY